MAVYVNIKGTNASRKSTKIDCLLKYLLHKGAIEEKVEGGFLLSYNNKKYYFFGMLTLQQRLFSAVLYYNKV